MFFYDKFDTLPFKKQNNNLSEWDTLYITT